MPAVGLTDHGSLAGAIQLFKHAGQQGVKPIIGCEVYVCDDASKQEKGYAHLTLLAESNEGYGNLIKLASAGYLQGYYYKPRVDWSLLETHSPGLIALSGCLSGRVSKALEESREADAAADLDRLVQVFGRTRPTSRSRTRGSSQQARINPLLARMAEGTGLPLVATGDVHYLLHEDARAHEALLCIQSGDSLKNPNHWRFDTDQFYFKTPEEMAAGLRRVPGTPWRGRSRSPSGATSRSSSERSACRNTRCPEDRDAFDYLVELCEKGLAKRYDRVTADLQERLKYELKVIREMGFSDYFLIVWDFVNFAKRNGISVGPGRGSTAGSLAAYCLEITDVDPIRYDLLFERFLNPGRKSMPDMDIDFSVAGRDRVINYVAEKYGRDRVAQIITFGTMMARAAVRDAGRVLEIPYGEVDKIAKLIPEGPKVYLDECLKPGAELKAAYDNDPQVREIVDLAKPLEGLVRQDSIHAAGVVISDRPLTDVVPLQRKGEGQETVTQFGMWDVEALGLLKMDFLGLRNLDVIDKAVDLIGGGLDIAKLPMDDAKTFEMLARGDAIGVFQFESSGMREALKQVRPTEFEDLIALVALYRPGPMGYIPSYAKRKNGREPVTFIDKRLEAITGVTHGICIYQEQYLEIAKQIAGFSPAEADDLRKAIGKKIHELMASLKEKFLEGCAQTDTPPAVANQLWKDMESSQDYSFGKAHSACYAMIAYRTAWLRANHPREYMAALISSVMNTKDRVPFYVSACHELGIEVQPPDVNESECDFAVVEGKIRFGLNAVKNVGDSAARAIVAAREEGGAFMSIWDFSERVDPQVANKRALEALVSCGALDSTGDSRGGMIAVLDSATAWGGRMQADRLAGPGLDLRPRRRGRVAGGFASASAGSEARPRQERAPADGEGDARRLRLGASAPGDSRAAAAQDRLRPGGGREAARRRDRHGRRHRRRAQAADDEEGRADGLHAARRSRGLGRGRRLQLGLRSGARPHRAGQRARRQGTHRPQAGGRDEAACDGGLGVRGNRGATGGAAARRRAQGAGRDRPEPRRGREGVPGRDAGDRRHLDVAGRDDACARARLPGQAGAGLLRRGEVAPRRSRSCLTLHRSRRGRLEVTAPSRGLLTSGSAVARGSNLGCDTPRPRSCPRRTAGRS